MKLDDVIDIDNEEEYLIRILNEVKNSKNCTG